MKKNNIIILALTLVFVITCVLTFAFVSGKKQKGPAYEAVFGSETALSQTASNFFLTSTTQTTTTFSTLPADNHVETSVFATSAVQQTATQASTAVAIPTAAPTQQPAQTGDVTDKMCIITAGAADTWQGNTTDCTYIPYLSTLTKGTMDYVVGTSEKYDAEEEKTRCFYELSCGRKIAQSSAQLVPKTDMGDNNITVLSCSPSSDGELRIVLSQKWKVPYLFTYTPQSYYSSYGKKFFVNDFTAQSIHFTFYHTVSASGNVNTQGSRIVSSASWSSDPAQKTVTLSMPLYSQGKFYGYSAEYDDNANFIITIHTKPQTLAGTVVMLDPGHGGKDCGSLNSTKTLREAEINLAVALKTKAQLESRGATVYLTRTDNTYFTLDQRKNIAYSVKPDLFVSLHCDADESSKPMGTSAFYYKPMSKALSSLIHEELVRLYNTDFYQGQSDKLSEVDRKCKFHPFSVTRMEDCPSVLIEIGFITNDDECRIITDDINQQKIAASVASGIERYVTSY